MSIPKPSRIVPSIAAYGLIAASAGFGGLFAYRVGIEHSQALAILTVLFAVCLELLKPLAVVSSFQAAKEWQVIRSLLLAFLAAVAIVYSLTAELSLVSGSRSDLAARRASESLTASTAMEVLEAKRKELGGLQPSRLAGEISAEISKLYSQYPYLNCEEMEGRTARIVCPKIAALNAEKERTERRNFLHGELSQAQSGSAVGSADPASEALRTYFLAVGWDWHTKDISQWLLLVPIFALELGSALSLVLLRTINEPLNEPSTFVVLEPVSPQARTILNHLYVSGGSLSQSERELARQLGLDRNAARRAMLELSDAKLISHNPTKSGTHLRLLPAQQRGDQT